MATDSQPGKRQFHLQVGPGEVGSYVLLPGDPARTDLIARLFDHPRLAANNREFRTWTGELAGTTVSVTSTGIGGPSTAIAVTELMRLGARTFIRVGSCGPLQDNIRSGQMIIAAGAVRDEGTTRQYVPIEYPAVADQEVTFALQNAARDAGSPFVSGIVYCKDALTAAYPPVEVPLYDVLMQRTHAWVKAGVLASEMESAVIFVLASLSGARAGSILQVIGPDNENDQPSGVEILVRVAVDAVRHLIEQDSSKINERT